MAKRALLIGCNYPGTEAELNGCVNDVFAMKSLLQDLYDFDEESVVMLIDTDESYEQPTGRAIKENLSKLVSQSIPGDVLLMHFSGHGVQVPGNSPEEDDRKDEAIVPTDMNLILDDDFRRILGSMDQGVFFTCVTDCCHSGGMLDHESVLISGPKDGLRIPKISWKETMDAFGLTRQCKKGRDQEGVKNRSLPTETFRTMLSGIVGGPVELGRIHEMLGWLFDKDASPKMKSYLRIARSLGRLMRQNTASGQKTDCWTGFLALFSALSKHSGESNPLPNLEFPTPGVKPSITQQLRYDKGILITGCQSHETSADACPNGDKSRAFGALTNAVVTVARTHRQQHSQGKLSNRNLVYAVRELLSRGGYTQNPCLEGADENADAGFVVGDP